MKVAAVQFEPEFGAVARNARRMVDMAEQVSAHLYVFPELALSGYLFESREEAAALSQESGDAVFDDLAGLSSRMKAAVVVGFAERAGTALFNASLLIEPDGSRSVYRKIHLFDGEKTIFDPGDRVPGVTEVDGTRLGMMICFDWIFPETARTLALAGADVLCHCTNLVLPYCQDAMITRCIENRVFAVLANRTGVEERAGGRLAFTGRSEIVGTSGRVLARASIDGEEIITAEIDPAEARNKSITSRNDLFEDRRPGMYRLGEDL